MSTIQIRETAEPSVVTPSILDPRVERGAALLDERAPGWATKVDLETFVLADCKRCVLGQVFFSYFNGRDTLGLSMHEGTEHGFDVYGRDTHLYAPLEQDWRLAILSRRTANV